MCAMPEKKRDPLHEEFYHFLTELENDMLNIQQILKQREKSQASFDSIANELEALKENAIDCLNDLHELWNKHRNNFPKNTEHLLKQCAQLINNVHPEYLTQEKWAFNEQWLREFKKNLGY